MLQYLNNEVKIRNVFPHTDSHARTPTHPHPHTPTHVPTHTHTHVPIHTHTHITDNTYTRAHNRTQSYARTHLIVIILCITCNVYSVHCTLYTL